MDRLHIDLFAVLHYFEFAVQFLVACGIVWVGSVAVACWWTAGRQ